MLNSVLLSKMKDMKDKDFVQSVQEKLHELHVHRIELNEKARIANIFLKGFKSSLMEFIDNSTEEKILFTREMITSEPCDYNLRQGMDNDLIVEIVRKGYRYIEKESTSSELVFQKIE